jgi:mycothiol synthase
VPDLSTDVPDAAIRDEILRLAAQIETEDGAPPLSDQTLSRLRSPAVDHVLARSDGGLTGYAQRDGQTAEIAATGAVLDDLLGQVDRPGLRVWAHGRRSRLAPVLERHGFVRIRELHQLRRLLDEVPADPPLAADIVVRPFEVGRDEDAWLAVNAAAFATHPEQGRWTAADLQARIDEDWFDPAGFLLAERGDELLGYHWTKVHPDGLGEVYVLGISPAAQGLGLGHGLLVRGLRHLADQGCPAVLLYVDGDNPDALRLYERGGFTSYDLDTQWVQGQGGVS